MIHIFTGNTLSMVACYIDLMGDTRDNAASQKTAGFQNMAIGEFGGAPIVGGPMFSTGLYWVYEVTHAALNPPRPSAEVTKLYYNNPLNPLSRTPFGKTVAATAELFERATRRYGKPDWNIPSTTVGGEQVAIHINSVWER